MLAHGFSLSAILEDLRAVNATLPPKARITADSLQTHRARHYNVQAGASALWRRILEERAAAESATYEQGAVNLLTPRIFFETLLIKSYAGLTDEAAAVTIDQGVVAARELGKLTAEGEDEMAWARAHAQLNRVLAAFRELPPQYREAVLAKVEGRPGPPPTGSGRLALIEGGSVTGDVEVFDPLDGCDDDSEDED